MILRMRYFLQAILLFTFSFSFVSAADLDIRPLLIDHTVEPRAITSDAITLTNNLNRKATVYATVNEVTLNTQGEIKAFESPIMTDRTNTVTSWVEITRGRIELMPGETREVDLTLRLHPQAVPGEYHVFIGFVDTSKRYQAEAKARAGEADGVIVKVVVEDQRTESLRISGFLIDRFITHDGKRGIEIELENLGDITAVPEGEIVFYDSRGVEVSSVVVNTDAVSIPSGGTETITAEIPFYNELGRYKANLNLEYGQNLQANVFDTTQFYMMPLPLMIMLFGGILVIAIIALFLLRRSFVEYDEEDEDVTELPLYIKDGHEPNPQDHDIDLKNNNTNQ